MSQEPAERAGTGRDDTGRGGIPTPKHSGRLQGKGAILLGISHRPARVRFPPPPLKVTRRSEPSLLSSRSIGWGAFNVVEGLIDHQLLGIHHVHPGEGQLAWDMGFLLFGALLIVGGGARSCARGRGDTQPRGAVPPVL
ncbi:MAG TPA: DUF2243 domain-containing protein [Cystobacter sp.]